MKKEGMTLDEAIDFYVENNNWYNHHNIDPRDAGIKDGDLSAIDGKIGVYVGGKRARKAKAEIAKIIE